MKNTPLSELRKKQNAYFRKIGIVKPGRRKKSTIEYIVERTYEALPKRLKEYIDDKDQIISVITNTIIQSGNAGQMNPYEALKQFAQYRQKKSGDNTKAYIYRRFKEEATSVYNKYNTYVYRLGYSSARYFMENATISQEGSLITATLELPPKTSGIAYEELYIEYDFSGQFLDAQMY